MQKRKRKRMSASVGLLVILWSGAAVVASEGRTAHIGEGWDYVFAPYVWLAGFDAVHVPIGGTTAAGSGDIGDIAENVEGGAMGYFSARNGKWGIYVEATYVSLSTPATIGGAAATSDTKAQFYEVGGLYRVSEGFAGAEGLPVSTDLFFGARYVNLDANIQPAGGANVRGYEDWVDPIVGATYHRDFTTNCTLSLSSHFGGFGVGSDLTWGLRAMGGYSMSDSSNFWLGYRYLDIDYDDGTGASKFVFDVGLSGPILGASFHF